MNPYHRKHSRGPACLRRIVGWLFSHRRPVMRQRVVRVAYVSSGMFWLPY